MVVQVFQGWLKVMVKVLAVVWDDGSALLKLIAN